MAIAVNVAGRQVGARLSDDEAQRLATLIGTALRAVPAERRLALIAPSRAVLAALTAAAVEHHWRSGLVPVTVAAERLGLSQRTVRRRAERGLIAATKDGRRRWLVEAA